MMHIQSYQYSPNGFRSPLYNEEKREPEADPLVLKEWQTLITGHRGEANTWEFRRKSINHAIDLLRHLPDWLHAQEDNPRMTPHMRAFLEDTIQYINVGRRRMSIIARSGCLFHEQDAAKRPKYIRSRHAPRLKDMLNVDGKDYMYHWLKHDNGFDDMLATVNVLFGDISAVVGSTR